MDEKKYKLMGIYNDCGIVPNNVYPVFEDENKELYLGLTNDDMNENNTYYFTNFQKMSSDAVKYVKSLSKYTVKVETTQEYFQIGDISIYGIEMEDKALYIGTIDKYLEFLKWYRMDYLAFDDYEFKTEYLKELDAEIEYIEKLVEEAKKDGVFGQQKIKQ